MTAFARPARRLALTLLVALAVMVVARVPAPGLDLEGLPIPWFERGSFSPLALGLRPLIIAALVVEVLAALAPRWRQLRHGEGRARLLARSKQLAFALASVQAFFMYRWLDASEQALGKPLLPEASGARLLIAVAPIAGSMLLIWVAQVVGKHGIGNGFSVLIAAIETPGVVRSLVSSVDERLASGGQVLAPLAFSVLLVAALTASTARRPSQGWHAQPPRPELLIPASGILAWNVVETLLYFTDRLPNGGAIGALKSRLVSGSAVELAIELPLVLVIGLLCAWLFNRPASVAAAWARDPAFAGDARSAAAAARAAFRQGAWRALAFVGAIAAMTWFVDRAQVGAQIMWMAVIACVVADVTAELRFRRLHPDVVAVWPLHQTYTVGLVLHALARAGIPAFPRGLRHGALLNFWGPYVPVEIFVPGTHAGEADALLRTFLPAMPN